MSALSRTFDSTLPPRRPSPLTTSHCSLSLQHNNNKKTTTTKKTCNNVTLCHNWHFSVPFDCYSCCCCFCCCCCCCCVSGFASVCRECRQVISSNYEYTSPRRLTTCQASHIPLPIERISTQKSQSNLDIVTYRSSL